MKELLVEVCIPLCDFFFIKVGGEQVGLEGWKELLAEDGLRRCALHPGVVENFVDAIGSAETLVSVLV